MGRRDGGCSHDERRPLGAEIAVNVVVVSATNKTDETGAPIHADFNQISNKAMLETQKQSVGS